MQLKVQQQHNLEREKIIDIRKCDEVGKFGQKISIPYPEYIQGDMQALRMHEHVKLQESISNPKK